MMEQNPFLRNAAISSFVTSREEIVLEISWISVECLIEDERNADEWDEFDNEYNIDDGAERDEEEREDVL